MQKLLSTTFLFMILGGYTGIRALNLCSVLIYASQCLLICQQLPSKPRAARRSLHVRRRTLRAYSGHFRTGQEHARIGKTDQYTGGFIYGMGRGGEQGITRPNDPKPHPTADMLNAVENNSRPTAQTARQLEWMEGFHHGYSYGWDQGYTRRLHLGHTFGQKPEDATHQYLEGAFRNYFNGLNGDHRPSGPPSFMSRED